MTSPAYFEIVDFIASNNPEAVIQFRPSPEAQQRLADLVEREKDGGLSAEEKAELDHFMELEHIMRMARGAISLPSILESGELNRLSGSAPGKDQPGCSKGLARYQYGLAATYLSDAKRGALRGAS